MVMMTVVHAWSTVVRLVEEAPGQYRVDGESLAGVSSVDLTIDYDPASLSLSGATQGELLQDTLFAVNANLPGQVRIGAVGTRSLSGSGTLASLQSSAKVSPPVILGFTAKLTDADGQSLPVQTAISLYTEEPETPLETEEQNSSSSSSRARSAQQVSTGPISNASPWSWQDNNHETKSTVSVSSYETAPQLTTSSGTAANRSALRMKPLVQKAGVIYPSIFELFTQYQGPRSLVAMGEVFFAEQPDLQQRPRIALSDGQSPVEIEIPVDYDPVFGVALSNAKLLWSRTTNDGRWVVRCLPDAGAVSVRVLLLNSKELKELSLTIVPPVSLGELGLSKEQPLPRFDLNGDGDMTSEDDYILVGNLLARWDARRKKTSSATKEVLRAFKADMESPSLEAALTD
jgi:hypothetical protein